MFSTFLDQEDYTLPAIIDQLRQEATEARQVKASMDFSRYASRIGLIADALEIVLENLKGRGECRGGNNKQ